MHAKNDAQNTHLRCVIKNNQLQECIPLKPKSFFNSEFIPKTIYVYICEKYPK